MTHPTIVATADLHLLNVDGRIICQLCTLRGRRDLWLTERRLPGHLDAHRNAGHDVPEVEMP